MLLSSKNRSVGTSEFKVVRLLPSEGDDFQYCIKSAGEVIERVVKEYELKPYGI